jgi:AraC-like DNA-binding protein
MEAPLLPPVSAGLFWCLGSAVCLDAPRRAARHKYLESRTTCRSRCVPLSTLRYAPGHTAPNERSLRRRKLDRRRGPGRTPVVVMIRGWENRRRCGRRRLPGSVPNRKIGRARHIRKGLAGVATEEETMKAALQNYQARMRRVLDHIDQHLDDDLGLEALSGVAAFSKFHFHRQFTATFGLSVHRYVQLARMKRASYRLAHMDAQSVTEIAMDAGYDAPDAFARAFRQRFGQAPSSFRTSPVVNGVQSRRSRSFAMSCRPSALVGQNGLIA